MKRLSITLILTLTFLFTLTGIAFSDAGRHQSKVVVYETNAEADGEDKVYVDIHLFDKNNKPEKDTVFIATDRGSIDQFWVKENNKWEKVNSDTSKSIYYIDKGVMKAKIDKKMELAISSKVEGKSIIGVSLKDDDGKDVWRYVQGHSSEIQAEIIPVTYTKLEKPTQKSKYKDIELSFEDLKAFKKNELTLSVLDEDGNIIAINDPKQLDLKVELTEGVKNANVKLEKDLNWQEDLKERGTTKIFFTSDLEGEYVFNLDLKLDFPTSLLSDNARFKESFNLKLQSKQFGAKNLILFFKDQNALVDGEKTQMELGPFIKESRTFVPVRFLAESLGAEVKWNPTTKVITLDRPDKKITMVIGNNGILISNGDYIISDVAPFIKNDYTVLPFRVIAEAFGADVSMGYDSHGNFDRVIFTNN